jgi:hypothetical protein
VRVFDSVYNYCACMYVCAQPFYIHISIQYSYSAEEAAAALAAASAAAI